jgi:hypothetical protein
VSPWIPAAPRASFTSSSLNGLMMAMMSFMRVLVFRGGGTQDLASKM